MRNNDKSFAVPVSKFDKELNYYDVQNAPFAIYGVFYENGAFRRIPEELAHRVNNECISLHSNTAGGRVKFVTDSTLISLKATVRNVKHYAHCTLAMTTGFDLYVGRPEEYRATFLPPADVENTYISTVRFDIRETREITINFPHYCDVLSLEIGLEKDAVLMPAEGYLPVKPIVYYGSSITQGACASRPGNTYENRIIRELPIDYVNLGFSGSARGEDSMAQYIAGLDMSVFVYDYDYNAPTVEHLRQTHEKMFRTVRERHPNLPVVMLTRPKFRLNAEELEKRAIVKETYDKAVADGDRNVYFIDGPTLMQYAKNDCSVDGAHPNDLGFCSMATVLLEQLKRIL